MKKSNKITPAQGKSVTINTALDKFSGKVLFEEKIRVAKSILAQAPVPEALRP